MSERGDRVKEAREGAGLSQGALAAKVGIKQATIAGLESGRYRSSVHLVAIAAACGVTGTWLDTGKGPKYPRDQDALLATFASMTPKLQKRALAVAQALKDSEEA